MRVLALDVGDRRIGLAVSDTMGLIASPLEAIVRTSQEEDVGQVLAVARENDVVEIVVGMPLTLSGEVGSQAKRVNSFRGDLKRRAGVKVRSVDERYSTVEAERLMREAGAKPSRDRAKVDSAAAAVILQSYLDSRRSTP